MRKLSLLVKTLVVSTAGLSVLGSMSAAKAMNLVPQREGEIELTNMSCIVDNADCINTTSLGYTVTSKDPVSNDNYGFSRLFSDKKSTTNTWGLEINFNQTDEGTNPQTDAFWFRPVAYDNNNNVIENGRLEYGVFEFNFAQTANEVKLSFLDVEESPFTGILQVNGDSNSQPIFLPAAGDDETQYLVLNNVDSFVVQLGNPGDNSTKFSSTGDGVNLQVSVPEPGTVLSIGALAIAGMFGLRRKHNNSSKTA
ncbi:LEVG family PEP-CTERM protein [Mastigocoleus testarum]|uniref:Ice-binding protein C-terminal domain-containing protein n=1 Tax=Mastigocoleus testarum BC008 TaxID=371196 RepID=A0A0V7ZKW7_9CYAN|nr:LEVG family PEP-CTERM protein [Mastigocoleus testarum]KST64952.1 hypothetical protein BC008_19275 [Mastigocoleus testarum BC008]KST64999.1 hypothetical protein BC008_19530 [Mastigocoleus testarum BC008]